MLNKLRSFTGFNVTPPGWATNEDIKKSGLLNQDGIIIGKTKNNQYLRYNGSKPVLVTAPCCSGKGAGIVIPTLLTNKGSVIVADVKGHNYEVTSGYRQKVLGNTVLNFNPMDETGSSVRFNPLNEIRLNTKHEYQDAKFIATLLLDHDNNEYSEPKQLPNCKITQAFLTGVILYLKINVQNPTLADIAKFFTETQKLKKDILEKMSKSKHPIITRTAKQILNLCEKDQADIWAVVNNNLAIYQNPIIALNTSKSDFRISDLMNQQQPISLYLFLYPCHLYQTRSILRMVISLAIKKLIMDENVEYKYKLLLLIDEFAAFGKIPYLEESLPKLGQKGITPLLVGQDLNQIKKLYKSVQSFTDNSVNVFFTLTDLTSQKYFSKKIGIFNKKKLMTPNELCQMPLDEEIILVDGCPPIRAKKIRYFKDNNFTKRIIEPPEYSDSPKIPGGLP